MPTIAQAKPHLTELLIDVLRQLRLAHDRARSLEADVDSYRLLARQSIHALHELTVERDRLRKSNQRMREAQAPPKTLAA